MRSEVFTAVKMWIVVLQVRTLHSLIGGYTHLSIMNNPEDYNP
jgi:hypothetical protein